MGRGPLKTPRRILDASRRHREKNPEKHRERCRRWNEELRKETLAAYGGRCACPGCEVSEPLFLAVDHIDGGGLAERKKLNRFGTSFYSYLRKEGFPKDRYRLLCHNCNLGRQRNGGRCPHEKETE